MSTKKKRKGEQGVKGAVPAVVDQGQEQEGEAVALGDLTEKQSAFVEAFCAGETAGNGTKSAIAAGYSEKSSPTIAVALGKLPHVAAAIDAKLRAMVGTDLAAMSVDFLRTVLADQEAPLKLRTDVALKLVEHSGLVDRTKDAKAKETGLGDSGKPLGQLSRGELEAIVRQGAAILADAAGASAKVVEGHVLPLSAPISAPIDGDKS